MPAPAVPPRAASAPPERLDPAVADLVQRLEPFPTLVKGRRWDVLAANPAARELFADWAAGSPGERNLVRWMFTTDQAREVYLEWEPEARAMLGRFRLSAARYPDDPDVRALIAELQRDSEHVRDWWPRHDVAAIGGSGPKKLRHPRLGPIEYSHVVLQVADQPGPDPGQLLPRPPRRSQADSHPRASRPGRAAPLARKVGGRAPGRPAAPLTRDGTEAATADRPHPCGLKRLAWPV